MRTLLLASAVLILTGCAAPKTQTRHSEAGAVVDPAWRENRLIFADQKVSFAPGSSELSAEAMARVARVVNYMKANPVLGLRIEGHGDGLGTDEHNYELGDRRAEALQKELTRLGVDPDRIVSEACGKDPQNDRGYAAGAPRKWRLAEFILLTPPL